MVKKEGLTIAGGYGLVEILESFGKEGGVIAPEQLTELLQYVSLPKLFVIGAILWYFRSRKDTVDLTEVVCPYAPKDAE